MNFTYNTFSRRMHARFSISTPSHKEVRNRVRNRVLPFKVALTSICGSVSVVNLPSLPLPNQSPGSVPEVDHGTHHNLALVTPVCGETNGVPR